MANQKNKHGVNVGISWCDYTANLWWGCTAINDGCSMCYAETLSKRFGNDIWGNDKPRKEIKSVWKDLDKYQRLAQEKNEIHRVFVGSMMDIFEKPMTVINGKGEIDKNQNTGNLRFHLFYRIDRGDYPNLMFLFLTKRPLNINKYIFESWKENPPHNVMFGTSIVNQETANKMIPQLLQVNGKRFLSVEPQLGEIDFLKVFHNMSIMQDQEWRNNGLSSLISWVIQGGESGHNKRPFNLDWAYSMKKQCEDLDIPYFFKQIDGKKEIPTDLQVMMFPK